jgi:L-fuconolactonase
MTGKETTAVIDSHCHAWPRWPYDPPVPDDATRGSIEMLLHDMDQYGVDEALIVCAGIERNPDNNEYVAEAVKRFLGRIHQAIDIDSNWSDTYHAADAAARLTDTIAGLPIKAVSHYLDGTSESAKWLVSAEGMAFFRVIADNNLILSISGGPTIHPELRELAAEFPTMPILCPHLAGIRTDDAQNPGLQEVLKSASQPNIFIKASGLNYGSAGEWDYPYNDRQWVVRALYDSFGPERLCWGSNSPVSAGRGWLTYRQTIESVRSECDFISNDEMNMVMGGNLAKLLAAVGD